MAVVAVAVVVLSATVVVIAVVVAVVVLLPGSGKSSAMHLMHSSGNAECKLSVASSGDRAPPSSDKRNSSRSPQD